MYGQTDMESASGRYPRGADHPIGLPGNLDNSPIRYVEKAEAPVLLLPGEADIRARISQREEYYVALKCLGKTVDFARFPGCSHLFLRGEHPDLRREYYERVVGWFRRWVEPLQPNLG